MFTDSLTEYEADYTMSVIPAHAGIQSRIFPNGGKGKDAGFSIKNVENDREEKSGITDSACRWLFSYRDVTLL